MRKPEQLQNLYRYQPVEFHRVAGKYKPRNPEEENERCYDLIHVKMAPKQLKRLNMFNILILLLIVLGLFVGAFFLPKPTASTIEKRELAKWPEFSISSLLSGEFSHKMELYFSDTFPMREWFVSLSAHFAERQGIRFDNVRIIAPSGDSQDPTAQTVVPDASQMSPVQSQAQDKLAAKSELPGEQTAEEQAVSPVDENATGFVSNGTFICQGRAMSIYGGSHESARRYASVLNTYVESLPDVQVYNMIIPTAVEFYLPKKYASITQSQKGVIDLIYGELDSSVKKVNAYDVIKKHTDEYLYFRTDHHWTGRAAYYAYTAFCKEAGLTPLSIDDFETKQLDDFIGTMYSTAQDSTLLENPDYVEYYLFDQPYTANRYDKGAPLTPIPHKLWGEYAKSPNSYSVFLQGDFPLIEVDTGIQNGRKIMVVKESFGNAFAPFLINHYEKVYIVDQRYFEQPLNQFIKDKGINELLFLNNAFAVCTPYQISCIENLKTASIRIPPKPVEVQTSSEPEVTEPVEEEIEVKPESPKKKSPEEIERETNRKIANGILKQRNTE